MQFERDADGIKKLSAFDTYIAIIKGYCGPILLFITKAFDNGGWAFSSICLIISGVFTLICALKLIKIGKQYRCYCYGQIVNRIIGKKGRIVLEIMIVLTQFTFCMT